MRYAEQNMNSQPEKMQDGPALLARAWQLRNSAHFNGAEKACRTALSLNPQFGQAWHLLGIINHDQGNPVQAVAHLKQAVAVEPGEPLHYNNLGVVLHSMGRFADAETVLVQCFENRSRLLRCPVQPRTGVVFPKRFIQSGPMFSRHYRFYSRQ